MLFHRLLFIGCVVAALGLVQLGSAAPPSTPPSKSDTRPVIVAFGDSLTAGFGADPGKSFPDFLQKDLDAAGLHWRVVNLGVSGNTTIDGVSRLNEVLAYKPRMTIVEFGGNDGLRGLPVDTTRANLDQIIQTLEGAGSKIILAGMTLPPNYGSDYIKPFQQVYTDLAAKYKVTRIPFLLSDVALHPNLMQRDGIHPTAEGNQIVATTVMRYLKPLLH
ncbi:MAG TPA: arylesterase [Bryobacteraceae bacterium]|jgi:acyl-CoA thioesterase I|nr:arylesterase [Bryobacteraceae bacterium]